ncbi:TPA: hypothetical protein L9A86_005559, partial [Klebsiella pneumoniae]|nr:hypothetical protein [Klebsiella pneumoniae]
MASQVLLTQKEVAAIQYVILGKDTYSGASVFDAVAGGFRTGTLTQEDYITSLLASSTGQSLYAGKSDLDILKIIYTTLYGFTPDDSTLQSSLNTEGLGGAIYSAIDNLLSYNGFDITTLTSQANLDNTLDAVMYKDYGSASWSQWSVALSAKEQAAAAYLTLADRSTDMSGLGYYTNYLLQSNHSYTSLLTLLLNSSEFKSKGASLTGDD